MKRFLLSSRCQPRLTRRRGFTLVEAVVAMAVLGIAMVSIFALTQQLTRLANLAQRKAIATGIAQQQLEIVRNVPYASVGTENTFPTGPLLATQTIVRDSISYTVNLVINDIDDQADLLICDGDPTHVPCDTVVPDYKQVESQVCWDSISCLAPVRLTTFIVPKNIENTANTGALFITVLDANGQPVPAADVTVTNASPTVHVVNRTDVNGRLQLLSLPPASDTYHIAVTKNGYTSDGTITPDAANPNPINPDTSVVVGSITPASFAIDLTSQLEIRTLNHQECSTVGSVQVRIRGQRLIGKTPDVYLYDQSHTLDSNGALVIPGLAWDDYTIDVLTSAYDVAGINPPDRIVVNPNTSVISTITLAGHQTKSVRFVVRDAGTKLPLAGAIVRLTDGAGYDTTLVTEQGALRQSDWSGGPGQNTIGLADKYFAASGGIYTSSPQLITLSTSTTAQSATETFDTVANRDVANTTATWSTATSNITLAPDLIIPGQYLAPTQAQSSKINTSTGRIVRATLTATADLQGGQSISYFLASDGVTFEPVNPGEIHTFSVSGDDLRWRAVLDTTDYTITPNIDQININYDLVTIPDTTGTLTSSTFDSGVATNYLTLSWDGSTPAGVGAEAIRFQVAANNDQSSWEYIGPDGTSGSYFNVSGNSLPGSISGNRYLRYKSYLQTASQLAAPSISSISIIKNNACTPPGQTFFSPLPISDNFTITTTLAGYQDDARSIEITGNPTQYIDLLPNP